MTALESTQNVTEMLANAIETGAATGPVRDAGARLLEHLRRPTVIVVAGRKGGGKSSLINMLTGTDLMPALPGVAITELTYGETPQVIAERHNGTEETFDGTPAEAKLSADTLRVRVRTPDDALRDRTFIEVSLPEQQDMAEDFLDWGLERADVAIWCTQNFDDREYRLWASAPDHLKDRSFLALTKADQLHMKGTLTRRLQELDARASEEFYGLYPLATLQALAARDSAAEAASGLLEASGGKALRDGLEHQIASGRMADMDHALILLERLNNGRMPAPGPAQPDTDTAKAKTAPEAPDVRVSGDLHAEALVLLDRLADDLCPAQSYLPDPSPARILSASAACAAKVSLMFEDCPSDNPRFHRLRDEVIDAAQMITLLASETGPAAAADALALMVQLRKEIHAETI